MESEGSRLVFFDTLYDGFGVARFSQPVSLTELRIVPRGKKLSALSEHLLGSTFPPRLSLQAYVHLPPSTIGAFSRPASMLPLQFDYDGNAEAISSYRLDLPTSTNSRMMVIVGNFQALTVALYGSAKGQGLAVPPKTPTDSLVINKEASNDAPVISPEPLPLTSMSVAFKPDIGDYERLLKQRPTQRNLDIDPFQDPELEIAVGAFDGDRTALARAISRCLDAQESSSASSQVQVIEPASEVSWREVLTWSATRIGKMTEREVEMVARSLSAQDWLLDDDRPDWVNTRRMAKAVQSLAKHSQRSALCLLSDDFLERTMILACESSTSQSRLAFLSSTLACASEFPTVFLSLLDLPSYAAFIALPSPARETLIKRQELVSLLTSALTDEDDLYSLAECLASSHNSSTESLIRYLRHFDVLAALEPLLIDLNTVEYAEPIIHILATLSKNAAGRLYLIKHLQEPGVLVGRLVEVSEGQSEEDALWAFRRLRRGEAIDEPRALCKAILAVISVTAIAVGLHVSVAMSACSILRTLANDATCNEIITFVLQDSALLAGLIGACQNSVAPSTAWTLLEAFISHPLLYQCPATILDALEADLPGAPLSLQALLNDFRRNRQSERETGSPCMSLIHAMASVDRRQLMTQSETVCNLVSVANNVASVMHNADFARTWASKGGRILHIEVLRLMEMSLDGVDDLMLWSCHQPVGEAVKYIATGHSPAMMNALLNLMDVSLRMLSETSARVLGSSETTLMCLIRALLFCRCGQFSDRTWHWTLAQKLATTILSHLVPYSPTALLKVLNEVLQNRPALYNAGLGLVIELMPSKPSKEWAKAFVGHIDLFCALHSPTLLARLNDVDKSTDSVGLISMFNDARAENEASTAVSTKDLLLLVETKKEDLGDTNSLASGGEFSSKNYHGDAFRLQANEKLNVARPPSMHVDLYQGNGLVSVV